MKEKVTEEMKVRISPRMKQAMVKLAGQRFTTESAIARIAVYEYLRREAPMLFKSGTKTAKKRKAKWSSETSPGPSTQQ